MSTEELAQKCYAALNRLTKWRTVFTGQQLGTRPKGDPECDAVRDHREVTILLRCEMTAVRKLLIENGVFTLEEWQRSMIEEANLLSKDYEKKFPGFQATDTGMQMDVKKAHETTKHWKP
jgi:hypothetical protein